MVTASTTYTPPLVPDASLEGDEIEQSDPRFRLIWMNPERVSGAPCFFGTRVPVQTLFDYIEAGDTIDDFLDGFPPITRAHVLAVLELAKSGHLRGADDAPR